MTIRDIAIAFGYEVDRSSERKANDSIDKLKSVATKILGAIGIGFSLVNANEIIEEFGKINAQIKNATEGLGDQRTIQDEIITAANAARMAYSDIAGVTSKLVQQNRDLFDVTSAAKYAELTAKLFKSENKSQNEILSLQEAINKSFAKGAVEAETISQIIENSPAAAALLADKIGVAKTELEEMSSDGRISLNQLRDAFLGNADSIESAFANVDITISDALLNMRNQWGLWLTQMDKTLGITKNIAKIMVRTFTGLMNILRKAQMYTQRFVDKLGGSENAFKLLAMAAGSILIALNAGKIIAFLKTVRTLITAVRLKTLALAAVIFLIALAVDDFIHFMKGNKSVIGVLFEKWGIDADEVRKRIIKAWESIKTVLLRTWDAIKDILKGAAQFLTGVFTGDWDKAFGGLKSIVGSTFSYIEDVFGKFAPVVKAVAVAFAAWKTVQVFSNLVKGTVTIIKQTAALVANTVAKIANAVAQKAWNVAAKTGTAITKGLGAAFKFLASPAGLAVVAIAALAAIIVMLVKNGGDVDALVQQFTDGLGNFISVVEKVVAGIAEKAPQIIEAIVNAVTKVLNVIVEKLPMFIDMGIKLVTSLIDGIVSMLPIIIEAVIKLLTALIGAIVNLLPKLINAGIKLVMSLIDGIVSALPQIIAAIVGLIPVLVKAITDNLPKIIKAGIQIIVSLVNGIVQVIPQLINAITGLIPVIIKALIDILPKLIQAGIEITIALANGLIQAIPELLKAIPQIIGALLDGFKELFPGLAPVLDGVKNHFEIVFNAIAKIFETVINIFKTVFGIYKSLFTGDWKGLWDGIKEYFSQVWELVKTIFSAVFDEFKNILDTFLSIFMSAFTTVFDFFKGIWSGISDFFSNIWDGIKSVFNTATDFFGGIFTGAANAIKTAFDGIKEFFSSLFQSVANVVKAPINGIISGVNGVLSGLSKIKIPDWVPGLGGKALSFPTIPQLAKGGVLKKGQTGYLEGDGTEAVVPLEKNTEWIAKVAALFKKDMSFGGGSEIAKGITEAFKGIGGMVTSAVKSISDVKTDNSGISDALHSFGENIAALAKSAAVGPNTVQSMVTSTSNRNITQNNYFESTFNGDRAGQKRSSEAMSKNANDATGELARALAFTR